MSEKAKLILEGKEYELPVVIGTENEKAIDISKLLETTGYITLDTGFKNTGSTKSAITFTTDITIKSLVSKCIVINTRGITK